MLRWKFIRKLLRTYKNMKKTVYDFLKRKYPKHLILFSKNDKIKRYSYDYDIYTKYNNVSYIIVNNNELIKKDYKDNNYDEAIVKYKLINILEKVGKRYEEKDFSNN